MEEKGESKNQRKSLFTVFVVFVDILRKLLFFETFKSFFSETQKVDPIKKSGAKVEFQTCEFFRSRLIKN